MLNMCWRQGEARWGATGSARTREGLQGVGKGLGTFWGDLGVTSWQHPESSPEVDGEC